MSLEEANNMAKDPVCGMMVDEENAAATSRYEGKTYYFCAPRCKVAFDKDPEQYLNGEGKGEHQGMHGMHH
jgi:YHS domain-containing protein